MAKKRAEEQQEEINNRKRLLNLKAHQDTMEFEIPKTAGRNYEDSLTEEQTSHSFFQGKETRLRAMLKAKHIQMYKREKTTKHHKHKARIDGTYEGINEDKDYEEPIPVPDTVIDQDTNDNNDTHDRQTPEEEEQKLE
eukprot:5384620-Heterocapsa_arctica.AAC.1